MTVYEELSVILSVIGYLAIMKMVKPVLMPIVAKHLNKLMDDAEVYHDVWLQQIENGEHSGPMQMPRSSSGVLWCGMACSPSGCQDQAGRWGEGTGKKQNCDRLSTATIAKPDIKACSTFNKVGSMQKEEHPADLHICTFCLSAVNRQCAHSERLYRRKQYTGTTK